jgi:hypothetical protein
MAEDWLVGGYAELVSNASPGAIAVREAMGCGELAALLEAVTEPLTVERFADNIRAAPSFFGLRFSSDPLLARQELCG